MVCYAIEFMVSIFVVHFAPFYVMMRLSDRIVGSEEKSNLSKVTKIAIKAQVFARFFSPFSSSFSFTGLLRTFEHFPLWLDKFTKETERAEW